MKSADQNGTLPARVKIPVGGGVPRYLRAGVENRFVRLEDLMIYNADLLFPETEIISCDVFRVTRNANTENKYDGAVDMREMIEGKLQDRKFAPAVRLQTSAVMDPVLRKMLASKLGLDEKKNVFESNILVRMSDLMEIAALDIPSLHD